MFGRRWAPERIEADVVPALGPEPPALVNALVHGGEPTRDAVAATLLDLAARDVVGIEEVGPGVIVCRQHHNRARPRFTTAYEDMVLDALDTAAVGNVTPVESLSAELRHQPAAWMRAFRGAVVDQGRAAGLLSRRWTAFVDDLLVLAGLAAFGAAMVFMVAQGSAHWAGAAAVFGVGFAAATAGLVLGDRIDRSPAQRLTGDGRRAAARWLAVQRQLREDPEFDTLSPAAVVVWRRYLAYGAALGVAHAAADQLPLGADDGRRAWSAAGGRWRPIRIRYPRLFPPAWGRTPLFAALGAVGSGVLGAGLVAVVARPGRPYPAPPFSPGAARAIGHLEPLIAALGVLLLAWATIVLATAGPDLVRAERVEGRIVRLRARQGTALWWEMPRLPTHYYLALDDGSRDRLRAYRVRAELWRAVEEGDHVALVATRRLGYVERIIRLDAPVQRRHHRVG